jgi:ATP-dependent Zn protease
MSGGGAGGGGHQFLILASQSKIWWKTDIKTTLKDVAGLEEQKKKYKKLLNS